MFISRKRIGKAVLTAMAFVLSAVGTAGASELDLVIPSLAQATYSILGLKRKATKVL